MVAQIPPGRVQGIVVVDAPCESSICRLENDVQSGEVLSEARGSPEVQAFYALNLDYIPREEGLLVANAKETIPHEG